MADETLRGWKDIAKYLRTSERSAQRWEQDLGLPIRRMRSSRPSVVNAFPAELDEWRRTVAPLSQDSNGGEAVEQLASLSASDPAVVPTPWIHRRRRLVIPIVLTVVFSLALAAWLVSNRASSPRVVQESRPTSASPVLFLRVSAPNGVSFKTGIANGATGAIELPDHQRVLLSPTLADDMVHVRVSVAGANGTSTPVGTVDLKQGVRVLFKHTFPIEIEWVGVSGRSGPTRNADGQRR